MKRTLLALGLALVAVFFSDTVFLRPLWLLVTALHEASHGLAVVMLGGEITSFRVNLDAGGWCGYRMEPSYLRELIVASAGYTGSLLIGGILLVLASATKKDRWVLAAFGLLLIYLSWLCLKNAGWFGTLFCAGTGLAFLGLARASLGQVHDFVLRTVALCCMLMAAWDVKDDLVDRTVEGSDGYVISKILHIPSLWVGVAWLVVSIALVALFLRWSAKVEKGI
ncbi:MAG TPA: M50 family metallopeptidase [Fibrobacteria bacterium]|nr:M50 family metallopeptidase [Fibrobacteria bacterium]